MRERVKIGVISNSRSERNRGGLPAPLRRPSAGGDVRAVVLDGVAGLAEVVRDFAAAEVSVIVINGGDGTVSATLTALLRQAPAERLPLLAVLPGGMTNMIADDVGLRGGDPVEALTRLTALAAEADLDAAAVERRVIELRHHPGLDPLYGMFFGTAAIYRAIVFCRERIHAAGLKASVAVAATLAYAAVRVAIGGVRHHPLCQGEPMRVRFDDGRRQEGDQMLALVTTLERLILGSRPFWGREDGGLRFTSVAFPPTRLLRSTWPVLYGGPGRRRLPAGYVSRNAGRIAFEMACPFTLDGELFTPSPDRPVELRDGGGVRFLRC